MGIKDLAKVPGINSRQVSLADFKGFTFAIDASIQIIGALVAVDSSKILKDKNNRVTMHINTILNKVNMLHKNGISQIWVFDGKNSKKVSNQLRKTNLKQSMEKSGVEFGPYIFDEVKFLFDCMGIPYVDLSKYNLDIEAEAYCAHLVSTYMANLVFTTDSDALAFGAQNMLRWVKTPGGKPKYLMYSLDDILKENNITQDQFVTMCVALGTDFNDRIKGVGPKTVLKKLKDGKINLTPELLEVKNYFMQNIHEYIEPSTSKKNLPKLQNFLVNEKSFNEDRIKKILGEYA